MGFVLACFHVLNSLKFSPLTKNHPREWRVGSRFLRAYAGLLVNAMMIAMFVFWRLEQKRQQGGNADGKRLRKKRLIVSNYSRTHGHMVDPSYFRIQNLGAL